MAKSKNNFLDKELNKMADNPFDINAAAEYFEAYADDHYETGVYKKPKTLEQYFYIWRIGKAGFKAGCKATVAFMNGGKLPHEFKTL